MLRGQIFIQKICDPQTDHTLVHVTFEMYNTERSHVQYRRRTWRILSTGFNSKEITYLLLVYEQDYLPVVLKLLEEVYYCQTNCVGDKYKFLLSQFVQ